jgi:hypothetical protein
MGLPRRRSRPAGGREAARAVVTVALLALSVAGCGELEESQTHYPVKLEAVPGTEVKRVTLLPEGAKRIGLETVEVRRDGDRTVIPYGAVVYTPDGRAFAYTSPRPLTYVREEIEIEDVRGKRALLSKGPAPGTHVVATGTAEVYGSEFEVDH